MPSLYPAPMAATRAMTLNFPSTLERHQGELLRTSSVPDFSRVQVALTVDRDVVHPLEFARHAPGATEGAELPAARALERVDPTIRAIGDIHVFLFGVVREHHVPHGAVRARERLDAKLLHELAGRLEHLDAIVHAIADVNAAIVR